MNTRSNCGDGWINWIHFYSSADERRRADGAIGRLWFIVADNVWGEGGNASIDDRYWGVGEQMISIERNVVGRKFILRPMDHIRPIDHFSIGHRAAQNSSGPKIK